MSKLIVKVQNLEIKICNLQYNTLISIRIPITFYIFFVYMVLHFSDLFGNFSGAIQRTFPMWPSIAHIPYSLHALMIALHMFFMEWFILILTRILLSSPLKFLEDIQAQMGEVRTLNIRHLFSNWWWWCW